MIVVNRLSIPAVVTAVAASLVACAPSHEELVTRHDSTIARFCVDCHNDAEYTADLSLEGRSLGGVADEKEIWETVAKKLRGGMMPPNREPRPDPEQYLALTEFVEAELDTHYEPYMPPPGIHRLNRAEYGNAIRDLLALEVDPTHFLPADDSSRGFDNQAGSLTLSPALLEAYLSAAGKISRLAVGSVDTPSQTLYRVAEDTTQNYHVPGLPLGTRGGILIDHQFPADGEYRLKIFSVNLGNMGNFRPFGEVRGEQLEILLDGERVALVDWDEALGVGQRGGPGSGQLRTIDVAVPVSAGPHEVGVTFLATNYAPGLDLNNDFERSTIETGGLPGFTFYPHVGSVRIDGPYNAARPDRTPSRDRIFVCYPSTGADERACAEEIVAALARRAYRGFVDDEDIATLMEFFEQGSAGGDFDTGIEMVVQRILVEPKFIYRIEQEPEDATPNERYRISDLELASRLSFFLWSSIPDDRLLEHAERGRLGDPEVLVAEVDRMLDDPRSSAFTENFAGQWLALRNLASHSPVVDEFPDYDDNLRQAFRRETELLFDSIIRENRPVTDLLTADYTFVNDRLAKHYGIPGIQGSQFRRVELGEDFDMRRGLLGKGSVLTVSSQPARTAPVMRGAWIMGQVIGIPAPDPPPDVPLLSESPANDSDRTPTIREQYEAHRTNPVCLSCHSMMDPFGFALENFDATGRWRTEDAGNPIDPTDVMYDGTLVTGPADLRDFLLKYEGQYVRNVTEKLMIYALGRGIEYYDMPVVRSIVRDVEQDDYRFKSLIRAVVLSEPFRMSTKIERDGAAAGRVERDSVEAASVARAVR